ncbi:TPA: hypothetical protein OOF36_001845 [Morganella morganii]|nr:hypothetical protein [Escherichia coli]HCR4017606.1 hypothetical protein [Morganella morganii]
MTLFNLIYYIACGVFFITDLVCRTSRIREGAKWLLEEARRLQDIASELKQVESYTRYQHMPGAKELMEYALYHTGFAFGELAYWRLNGRMGRLPSCLLRRLEDMGHHIDAEIWLRGYEAGFYDIEQQMMEIEIAGEYPEYVELSN